MVKKTALFMAVVLSLTALWQHELLLYGISQAKGQLKVIWNARDIQEVLHDPVVADSLKQKIRLVQEIRTFAIDSLGLKHSDSYQTIYDQQGKPVLWVVTACEPFSLEDKTWRFPLLGSFSYKGFFDYDMALAEMEKLQAQGYDTGIRTVSAWSTLGILNDPIMSELLFRDNGNVANTVIHELTHGTIFVKDNLKFNENLASFIGHEGALRFLKYKYGENTAEYQYYETYMSDRQHYVNHMLRGTQRLDSLYTTFDPALTDSTKLARKRALIQDIVQDTDTIQFENPYYVARAQKLQQPDSLPNNTFFKAFVRYQSEVSNFETMYRDEYNNNLKSFLAYLKQEYPSL